MFCAATTTESRKSKKKVSEYDQEMPHHKLQTNRWHREEEAHSGRQHEQSNQLSLPHQDDCKTRMDIK